MLPRLPAPVVSVCLERPWKDVSAARVHAVLQEQWESIDADAPSMMRELQAPAFAEFSHARDTFRTHLIGTFATLGMWMQPDPVLRCGLFHTAYGGDLFRFHAWNGEDESHRARVRRIIGREAESLVWLFGTLRRGELIGLEGMMRGDARPAPQMSHSMLASHWSGARVNVSAYDVARVMIVTIADHLDQLTDVSAWRDHHQQDVPIRLYPGDGRPGVAMHWMAELCASVRAWLDAVPPVFDGCTAILSRDDEVEARDAYWEATMLPDVGDAKKDGLRREELLQRAARLNPHVGEPLVLLAQLSFPNDVVLCHALATNATRRMLRLGSAWDKRRSYASWVAFARTLSLRAQRLSRGDKSLPTRRASYRDDTTDLHQLTDELPLGLIM